ncbi:unnamed protein product [Caenorhabditis sp. 36 PRJEB53466]|nr:unnamed protein product [Caenorhabditis sp. 36 PRJEB53466]
MSIKRSAESYEKEIAVLKAVLKGATRLLQNSISKRQFRKVLEEKEELRTELNTEKDKRIMAQKMLEHFELVNKRNEKRRAELWSGNELDDQRLLEHVEEERKVALEATGKATEKMAEAVASAIRLKEKYKREVKKNEKLGEATTTPTLPSMPHLEMEEKGISWLISAVNEQDYKDRKWYEAGQAEVLSKRHRKTDQIGGLRFQKKAVKNAKQKRFVEELYSTSTSKLDL